jgi:hypothetical protein
MFLMQTQLVLGPFVGQLKSAEAELAAENGRPTRMTLTSQPTKWEVTAGRYALRRLFLTIEKYQYEFLLYPYGNKPPYPIALTEKTTVLNLLPRVKFDLSVGGVARAGQALYPRVTVQTENGMTLARLLPPVDLGEAKASILLQDAALNTLDTDNVRFT